MALGGSPKAIHLDTQLSVSQKEPKDPQKFTASPPWAKNKLPGKRPHQEDHQRMLQIHLIQRDEKNSLSGSCLKRTTTTILRIS